MKKLKVESLHRLSVSEYNEVKKSPIIVVLDNVRSLHNVGSVFRSADAFRVQRIFLTGITGTPPHREIHKTALGATDTVAWRYFKSIETALHEAKKEGYRIILIEQTDQSVPLQKFEFYDGEKLCLVFGNEVSGVSNESIPLADCAIEIVQAGTKHSLNISVCVGIVLWALLHDTLS